MDASIIDNIAGRLLAHPPGYDAHGALVPDWAPSKPFDRPPVYAAVLISLIARPEGHTVLYTERSSGLRAHSGQVAFPGGKLDPEDFDAGDAALREAGEEVGMVRDEARILGFMPTYFTGTNYLITPVVAEVAPTRPFVPNPGEVQSLFEVPLARILDARTYGAFRIKRDGREHQTWQIDHDGHKIWGITANLTRLFCDRVNGEARR
ncbi:CoA pyrophosphatase [Devosia rhodophyticola]|uniref:CoA pyrophosphatase n=1 Tax=Devosia rhodophyticola TaxID=3026423 RepID=A0ABY7YUR8_9HYPH|nr:CoA pyrophosphatase [Devosia rhodophyticola]WDR05054.1 CoA pyrophosphatase [Devosia rhodophyticola]